MPVTRGLVVRKRLEEREVGDPREPAFEHPIVEQHRQHRRPPSPESICFFNEIVPSRKLHAEILAENPSTTWNIIPDLSHVLFAPVVARRFSDILVVNDVGV
jgi:hypothetical protein